ncbi:hypothetical protein BDB00DRAFT_830184 [Zychaea mexicana]|uniref:uncharacterized protein n=1 Tax=Zychaea mexicana TaxID=64656 RepID=UPI0022FE2DD8|nr:uncharacterized protein BDB00DRAFT_830184 [Zychaea mexicana]KAI9492091.1 hypothetical protein BDB00DRAFT_830184 [Zychaea mexicana]
MVKLSIFAVLATYTAFVVASDDSQSNSVCKCVDPTSGDLLDAVHKQCCAGTDVAPDDNECVYTPATLWFSGQTYKACCVALGGETDCHDNDK